MLSFLAISTSSSAQNRQVSDKTSIEKARILTDKQKEQIDFSDDQEKQMFDINLRFVKEMDAISQEGRTMSTFRKLRDMSNRKDKEVNAVLNKDQFEIYKKLNKDIRSQMKANRGGNK